MLKPEARRWRTALRAAASGAAMPELPPQSTVLLDKPRGEEVGLLARLGFRALGSQMLRVDLVERLATHAFEARAGKHAEVVDRALVTSLGLQPQALGKLMRDIGFREAANEVGWIWRGQERGGRRDERKPERENAFSVLAELRRG
jgi:ATP-dependent RNA helicase SUPV3L1/SUV3